ncbi:MAG: hypothetical protein ABSB86_02965 [Bryobacteraceae bacterium]
MTITTPQHDPDDPDGFFPLAPASVCIEGPPQRQCYTAPEAFGNDPKVALVELGKNEYALLFSAASGGVSGWQIYFALLCAGKGRNLDDLFLSDVSVSNQNQHAFWNDPEISESPIFLTAEFVWGPDEGHYGEHRYIISAYVRMPSSLLGGSYYQLADRYMTIHKSDLEANAGILNSEKQEIIIRLKRVRAETDIQQRAPR